MTRMGRATEKGLDEVSKAVLGPVFHAEGALTQKVFVDLSPATTPRSVMQDTRLVTACYSVVSRDGSARTCGIGWTEAGPGFCSAACLVGDRRWPCRQTQTHADSLISLSLATVCDTHDDTTPPCDEER